MGKLIIIGAILLSSHGHLSHRVHRHRPVKPQPVVVQAPAPAVPAASPVLVAPVAPTPSPQPTVDPPAPAPITAPLPPPPPTYPQNVTVAVVNQSTLATNDQTAALEAALADQWANQVAPVWATAPTVQWVAVSYGGDIPAGAWEVDIQDHTSTGQYGYHSTRNNLPYAAVAVADSIPSQPWTQAASHETLEMLLNPGGDKRAIGPDGFKYVYEIADPVDLQNYQIDGVTVSDFAYPSWFVQNSAGPWDYLQAAPGAFETAPGDYIAAFRP